MSNISIVCKGCNLQKAGCCADLEDDGWEGWCKDCCPNKEAHEFPHIVDKSLQEAVRLIKRRLVRDGLNDCQAFWDDDAKKFLKSLGVKV